MITLPRLGGVCGQAAIHKVASGKVTEMLQQSILSHAEVSGCTSRNVSVISPGVRFKRLHLITARAAKGDGADATLVAIYYLPEQLTFILAILTCVYLPTARCKRWSILNVYLGRRSAADVLTHAAAVRFKTAAPVAVSPKAGSSIYATSAPLQKANRSPSCL